MKFKNIITVTFFSFFITACSVNQVIPDKIISKKQENFTRPDVSSELLSEISYILFLLSQNDLETLNEKFINPSFAYFELSRNIDQKQIIIEKKLKIEEINDDIESFDIKQEEAIFNCSPFDDAYYGWNKEGVFLKSNEGLKLSQLMKDKNLLNVNMYSNEEIKRAILIEKISYEVIVPYNIVFHLTLIDNKWYITLIDKLKTDCSDITSLNTN